MSVKSFLMKIFIKITSFLPRTKAIIFESSPYFSDNTYWFFKYLVENTDVAKKYTLVWLLKTNDEFRTDLCGTKIKCISHAPETLKEKLEYHYYMIFSKFIIDSNSYVKKKSKKQIRVFLGHGMPVKIAKEYVLKQGETDLNTITSDIFRDVYKQLGQKDEEMLNLGYCREDILAKNAGKRKNQQTKYIMWMPTYRQHKNAHNLAIENIFPLGLPVIKSHDEMAQINQCLKENNVILYLRPHPAQDVSVMKIDEMSNIVIADSAFIAKKGIQLYEFLTETDALITDYSSVYYDYLMLERPIALTIEDFDEFNRQWELFYNTIDSFKENYKSPYLYTVDDLKKFIKDIATGNDEYEQDRIIARNKFHDYPDSKSCERLYNYMVKTYRL